MSGDQHCCGNCQYLAKNSPKRLNLYDKFCVRHAPTKFSEGGMPYFAIMEDTMWCGDWAPKLSP